MSVAVVLVVGIKDIQLRLSFDLCTVYDKLAVSPPSFVGATHVSNALSGVGFDICKLVGASGVVYVVAEADRLCADSPDEFNIAIL